MWRTITSKSNQDTCFPDDLSGWLNQPPKISGSPQNEIWDDLGFWNFHNCGEFIKAIG